MDRYVVISDHMIDTDNVKSARIDRMSMSLFTLDPLGKISSSYTFSRLDELLIALNSFTLHMNKRDRIEKTLQNV